MVYGVFRVEKDKIVKIDDVLKDELVSKQSIAVRDAQGLGINKDFRYVLIEGSNEALKKAEELFKGIGEKEKEQEAEKIYNKIKEQEDHIAEGVGFVFGE
ncbi:MAG: hypothetical protein QMD21_02490 [Candidatus Thermoplasmatota archaeon]|nr:hypothetical protein [Candidatus Thermoplasmatota archaeon]MDI6887025.1 hypothetical protein [Candidatus Thermoplasmatota archaeon]